MNLIFRLSLVLGSILLILSIANDARSELITFQFAGTVTRVTVDGDYQSYDFPDVGDPFTGFYTLDSNAQDTANSPGQGSFKTMLPSRAVGITIGEFRFEGEASIVVTSEIHYSVGDHIPSIELTSNPVLAQLLDLNQFSLVVRKENLFADPNIPPLFPPSLAGADEATLTMSLDDRDDLRPFSEVLIVATLETLTIVPEPASAMLMGIASMLLRQNR